MSNALESLEQQLQRELGEVVIGMQPVVRALAIAVVARGHVLLQGAPGLGKTLLSKTLARALGGVFKRGFDVVAAIVSQKSQSVWLR